MATRKVAGYPTYKGTLGPAQTLNRSRVALVRLDPKSLKVVLAEPTTPDPKSLKAWQYPAREGVRCNGNQGCRAKPILKSHQLCAYSGIT